MASFRKFILNLGLESGPSSVLSSHVIDQRDLFTAVFPFQMLHALRAKTESYLSGCVFFCITPNQFEAQADAR